MHLVNCIFFKGLTQVEELLISRIQPVMSIYCLPHGQYEYSNHILNLPQDVTTFINTLPANLDVIIVRKEGAVDSHKDFKVRRLVVLRALQWLIENNIYYHDVTIDHSVLVVDGELTTNLRTMSISSSEEDTPARDDDDPYSAHL